MDLRAGSERFLSNRDNKFSCMDLSVMHQKAKKEKRFIHISISSEQEIKTPVDGYSIGYSDHY